MNNRPVPKISLIDAEKTYRSSSGETQTALEKARIDINEGEFVCLVGPSGCGKSTVINLMAGFEQPTGGSVTIDGKPVVAPDPDHIMLFQDYGLFPWKTALDNVLFGLKCRGVREGEAKKKALAALDSVGLATYANRHPHELSGGMKQRVSLARALAVEPSVLFMDEPFGALDAFTKLHLQDELLELRKKRLLTVVFVTHDLDEAIYLGDRVVLMAPNPGRFVNIMEIEMATPRSRTDERFDRYRKELLTAFDLVHRQSSMISKTLVTERIQQDGSGI
ncbi:MAG: ABC transporter ATP-binding protein [Chlorobiaceae bacterium]|nr:ABC transporter ATP-binding protein [Chlorobiaceae bacterium]